jgi:hypothetical protein
MSKEEEEADGRDAPNARSRLRALLQSLDTVGDFAGSCELPKTSKLPVISFPCVEEDVEEVATRDATRTTLSLPLGKSTSQYDALVKVSGIHMRRSLAHSNNNNTRRQTKQTLFGFSTPR